MRRQDPELTPEFRKESSYEQFIEGFNSTLATFEESSYVDGPEEQCTLHVIGVPRSGTTLAAQLIASSLDVAYINNLVAAFWRAPACGLRLSKKLLGDIRPTSFESKYGRTEGIHEPHEFGYFWSELIGDWDRSAPAPGEIRDIDWNRFRLVLNNMASAAGKPILFKSFQLAWHMAEAQRVLPRTSFIWIRRDPVDNAISLLGLRDGLLGSQDKWASFKPPEWKWLISEPPVNQVAGQVYFLERAIERAMAEVGGKNCLVLPYDQMCLEPQAAMSQVQALLAGNGCEVPFVSDSQLTLTPRKAAVHDPELVRKIEAQFERFRAMDGA